MSTFILESDPGLRSTVRLAGEFDAANAALLRRLLADAQPSDDGPLKVDLSAVTFFGAAAATALLSAQRARHQRSPLIAVRPSQPVRRVFELANLGTSIQVEQ